MLEQVHGGFMLVCESGLLILVVILQKRSTRLVEEEFECLRVTVMPAISWCLVARVTWPNANCCLLCTICTVTDTCIRRPAFWRWPGPGMSPRTTANWCGVMSVS